LTKEKRHSLTGSPRNCPEHAPKGNSSKKYREGKKSTAEWGEKKSRKDQFTSLAKGKRRGDLKLRTSRKLREKWKTEKRKKLEGENPGESQKHADRELNQRICPGRKKAKKKKELRSGNGQNQGGEKAKFVKGNANSTC